MPELPVKEVRLSELHLPELKRDEIVRSLSEIRRPAIELPELERPGSQVRESLARIDWSRLDPTAIDLGRTVAGVAAIARMGRPIIRSRWTLAVGTLVVIGLAGAALLSNTAVRERAGRTVGNVRARIDARSGAPDASLDIDQDVVPDLDGETLAAIVDADGVEPAIAAAESEIETEVVSQG